jgi:thiol-disulfide isomerase/thioredoxin
MDNIIVILILIIFLILLLVWIYRKQIQKFIKSIFINKSNKLKYSSSNSSSSSNYYFSPKHSSSSNYYSSPTHNSSPKHNSSPTHNSSPKKYDNHQLKINMHKLDNIKQNNITESYKNKDNITVILCYANWCGHCPSVKEWFIDLVHNSPLENVTFDAIEETNLSKELLSNIVGFPTILIKKNNVIEKYNGDRSKNALLTYLKNL